jgi:Ca2+-transporting ATPase
VDAHALTVAAVSSELGADPAAGLTEDEAARRLAADGPNELATPRGPDYLALLRQQVADPLVLLLLGAAAVSALIGEGIEAVAIAAIVVLNGAFGLWQDAGAARAVLALRAAVQPRALVLRGGAARELPSRELVRGDLVRLREGDRVPADVRIVASAGLEVDESTLTGESLPAAKGPEPLVAATPLAERSAMAYAGTAVTRGAGFGLVVATGTRTVQGQIVRLTEEAEPPPTPLQQRMSGLAVRLAVLAGLITLALAGAMVAQGESLRDSFLVGVSVAVAAVPEGLAATITVALALGAREMARRGAIVRTLGAIETIGEATVVCADKTGTLTLNRLRVERVEPVAGTSRDALLESALAAAEAEIDPVDRALVLAARNAGITATPAVLRSIPFEASRKRSAVAVIDDDGARRSVVKGAPEAVLALCDDGGADELARLAGVADDWARDGLRVLALASRPLPDGDVDDLELEHGLAAVGLIGLVDPLRPGAAASVQDARAAGLRVRILTGDHPQTAFAVGRALGLDEDEVRARCTPDEKLALVEELERAGEVVVVTGDGVNDAPALRRAHVGVAMGRGGTEAAREASSIVLTDDDFSTIVAAVAEGRRIAGNVRTFVAFLLSANAGEVVLFAVAVAAGLGAPMTVVQVLVVNLLTDGPPAIALARDPAGALAGRAGRGAGVLGRRLAAALGAIGLAVGGASLAAFLAVRELRPGAAQTAAFATVALAELALVYSIRSERAPAWRLPRHRLLDQAVAVSFALVLACVYVPFLQEPVGTVPLAAAELGLVALLALVPAVLVEAAKAALRRRPEPRLG